MSLYVFVYKINVRVCSPALVGTLMPGLDCNMDKIATEILSRWIAPKSTNVLPWNEIDERAWIKEFIIKRK